MLGYINVGKTSLIRQFVHHSYSEIFNTTIGVTIEKKILLIDKHEVSLVIWDIEGHATVREVPGTYLLGTHGIIYVFDLQRPSTWSSLRDQINFLENELPTIPVKIVGNKADKVSQDDIEQIRIQLNPLEFYTSSAKTGENVGQIFTELAKDLIQ